MYGSPRDCRRVLNEGFSFTKESDGYLHTEAVPGAKTFALWPLSQAAQSSFCKDSWPADIPAPRCSLNSMWKVSKNRLWALESAEYRVTVTKRNLGGNPPVDFFSQKVCWSASPSLRRCGHSDMASRSWLSSPRIALRSAMHRSRTSRMPCRRHSCDVPQRCRLSRQLARC